MKYEVIKMFSRKTNIVLLAISIVFAFVSAMRHDLVCTVAFTIGIIGLSYLVKVGKKDKEGV
jgi:hypothetical protein